MSIVLVGTASPSTETRPNWVTDPWGADYIDGNEHRQVLTLPAGIQSGDIIVATWSSGVVSRYAGFVPNLWSDSGRSIGAGVSVFNGGATRLETGWVEPGTLPYYLPSVSVYRGDLPLGALSYALGADATSSPAIAPQVEGATGGVLLTFWHQGSSGSMGATTPATVTEGRWQRLDLTADGTTPLVSRTFTGSSVRVGALVVTQPTAPLSPTLLSPVSDGRADLTGTPAFAWRHRKAGTSLLPTSGTQSAFALRRRVGLGAYEYWNVSTASWQASVVWNPSTAEQVTFPAGAWPTGSTYSWSVATQESAGAKQGVFATDQVVTSQAPPTVTVTAPVGSVATTQPTITWTATHPAGAVQTGFEVTITLAGGNPDVPADVIYTSGVIASTALEHTTAERVDNLTSYDAHVRVRQTGEQWSTWDAASFTTNASTPTAPALTVLPLPDGAPPMVTVTWDTTPYATLPSDATVLAQASDDGGQTWRDLRLTLPATSTRAIGDVEAQWGNPTRYRARVFYDDAGAEVTSSWATTGDVVLAPAESWLIDPLNPTVSVPGQIISDGDRSTALRTSEFEALGRDEVIVVSGVPSLPRGENTAYLTNIEDRAALLTLLTSQRTLLLCLAEEEDGRGEAAYPSKLYQRLVGDVTEARHRQMATQDRVYTWRWVAQRRPSGSAA